MSNIAKGGVRRIAVVALSLVAIVVVVAGLRAATPGVSGSTGSPGAVQQTVIGTASFFAQVGPVPSLIDFEDQPANAPLAPWAYAARGVIIEQLDGFPIYVGEWRYPESAMIVPSGTKAISSSWSGAPHGGFSQVCNAPPNCILFFNDGASDRIRFTFTVPVSAAGIHLGQNDVNGTRVTWYDTAGGVIESRHFPGFQPWSDFVGLVNASTPIGSMVVDNPANNGDAVYFDDLMFVPVTARASDERPFWTEAAPLNAARYGHTTTLLNDGRVLVAGGSDAAGTPLASAELYDPALNRWASVPSMTVARSGHGATLLGNGLVLVTGGSTATTPTKTAELYDPVANAWRSAGTMTLPRSAHSQTFLADGRVLVAGGYTPNADPYQVYANSAELYDPVPNTWTSTGSMQTRRVVHTATLLPDGRVLIAGGANYAEYVGTAEIFSPTTGTWTSAGAMSDRRYGAAAVTRPDGTVLVIGGANFFGRLATTAIFNPAGGWTAGPVMQSARFAPVAVAMGDQKILVAGGYANTSLVSAEILDPAASPGQWTPVASLHTARYSAGSAVLLQDGGVLVAGGYDHPAVTAVSGAEIWNSGRTITALTLDRAAGTFGGVVSLTARLTAFGSPVSGRSVLFALNGTAAGTATTDANGVATLNGVPVTNLNAGTYLRAVSASVDADATSTPSTATADLEIAKADAVLSVTSATIPYDGTPKQVSVTTTPSALTGITVTYDGSANPPSQPGTYAVVAHLDNPNYSAADAAGTLTIESRSTTTLLQVAPAVLVDGRPAGIRARVTNAAGLAVAGGSVRIDELAGAGIPQRTLATLSVAQDGTAFAVIPALSIGVHRLQAVYLGNGASDPSTSVEVVVTVVASPQGALRVWGSNSDGQIGNGQIGGKIPQPFSPLTSGVTAASGGAWHTVAATGDGRVWAWGRNDKGQLGIGTISPPQAAPALVPGVSDASQFAAGQFHTLALSRGSVWAWGSNEIGQLGDGSRTNRLAPVAINLGSVRAIAAGDYHSAALMNDGTVRTWGSNGFGGLGDGTSIDHDVPTVVPGLIAVVSIDASFHNTLALKGDGTVWSWGNNQWGQVGNGGTSISVLTPIQVPGLSNVIAVAAGYTHKLVLKDDGTVWAWGTNNAGQLGVGTTVPSYVAIQVPGLADIVGIAAGIDTSFAIAADGTVWGWGWNSIGQLAMPVSQIAMSMPVRLTLPQGIGAIVTGGYHVLGIGPAPLTIAAPASLAFGDQARATQGTPQRVTIVNRGNAALHVTGAEVTFNSSDYVIVADDCSGRTLENAPDAACTIDVAFRPASLGVRNAFLVITDDAPDSPHSIALSGTGLDPNRAPVAVASATPNPAEATSAAGAIVSIDATASSDPDGDPLTYRWTEGTTTVATTVSANVALAIGTHELTVTVEDGKGGAALSTVSIRVTDTTAPSIVIDSPGDLLYASGAAATVSYRCADTGSGIASCTGPMASGASLDTNTPGLKSFRVDARDLAGNTAWKSVGYAVAANACLAPPRGIVGWWSGDGTADEFARGESTELAGGATFAPGVVGQAFSLNGVNQYVRATDFGNYGPAGGAAVSSWIYPTSDRSATIFSNAGQYALARGSDGRIRVGVGDGTGALTWFETTEVAPRGLWTHVAVSYSNTTILAWINGRPAGSWPVSAAIPASATPRQMWIGAQAETADGFFEGLIDEILVFNRTVSDTDIEAEYLAGARGLCRPEATVLQIDPVRADYGAPVIIKARLSVSGTGAAIANKTINFFFGDGGALGTAATDGTGVARLTATIEGLNVGVYPDRLRARFNADPLFARAAATADLEIAKAAAVLSVTSAAYSYDGAPKQAAVTVSPSGLTGMTVFYNGSAVAPSQPGTYAVVAHLDNPNYAAADAAGTLTIESRSTTTFLQVAPAVLVDGRPAGIRARVTNAAGLAVAGGSVRVNELAGATTPQRILTTLSVGQDGTAFAVIPALSVGVHRLQAEYLGNAASDPSTSVEVVVTVVSAAQGALRAWGSNSDGQIGNGQIGGKFPQPFSPLTSGVTASAGGAWHTVAATSDGRVWVWGRNDKGQLGIGAISPPQAAPALVPGVSDVSQFAAGQFHTLALSHGSVWAWGSNETGQLGDGSRTNRLAPVGINLGSVRAIAAGDYHSAALMNDGTVRTWGSNGFGSLGDGTSTERDVPTAVPGLSGVVSIRASFFNTLALKGDGTVWSWGNNQWGQAGNGGTSFAVLTPIQVPGLSNVIAVAAGYTHRLVLKDDGTIWAWGTNNAGQLGVGTQVPSYVPVQVPGLTGIVAISAGVDTSFAIAADGTVWGWGWNAAGQLARPLSEATSLVPVRLTLPAGIGAIVSGGYHVLGIGPAPLTIVAPASLAFGDQVRATQGTPQRVTIVNRGNAALHVTSAEVTFNSSDYVIIADECSGRTLENAPDAACTIDVAFRPASLGVRNAFLVITDDAPDSPHSIPLSGTGLAPNRAPVAVAAATPNPAEATSAAGAAVAIDAAASTDPDGDSLTYRWTEGATTLATTASANVTLSVGTHVLTVVVDDGRGGLASASVSIRVDDTIAPTVTITSPLQGAIYLTGSQQRHAFTCQDVASGIASCTTSSASGEFINTATPGANTFVVTATDKAGNQTTQAVTYTVNAPPVAQSSTATVDEDTTSDIVISGADPDGSALTYAIAQPPVKGKIDAVRLLPDGRALVVYTPAQQFSGDDSFTFTVSDGVQTSSPAAVHITVTPMNDRPQIVMSAANTFGGRFGSATHVPVGQSPRAPVMADFNGDGRLDIAVANRTDRAITILLGDGGGAFVARTVDNVGDGPVWLAAGDFDGDTKVDLAVADQSWQAIILLGNGDGSFRPFGTISEVAAPQHVRTADMNRDGVLDLIFASFSSGVVFARGNGDGTFAPPESLGPVDLATKSVAAGDVNGDGMPDIVAANQQGNSLAVLLGSASQSFTVPTLIPQDWGPYSVELADFNGDGRLDIAAGVNIVNQVAIRLGNGDGTFGLPRYITTGVVPFSLAVADLNRDGRVDLVVANEASATGSVLLGRGDGTFDPPATYPTGTDPRGVAVGDLNGDGGLDLAIANMTGGSVSVLLAKPDGAAAPRYVEGASPIPLAGTAHVLDPDFAGGTLLVALANAQDGDLLTIATGSRVTASPNDISVDGQVIAVRSGGMNGAPLELTFNGAISLDAVDVVLQHVAFASSSENPSVQPRSVSLVVIDDAGAASDPLNVNVSVEAVNDAPTAVAAAAPNPAEATSSAGAVVTVDGAGTTDAEGDPLSYQWSEGTTILATTSSAALSLTVGDHVLVLRASDGRGGIAQKSILVTVKDTTAPVLSNVPADILAEATGASGATVSWTSPEATDLVEGDKTVTCAPASGSTFAIGQTSVRCETFDSRGNGTLAIFAVTVRDTTAPVIAGMPAAVSKEATGPAGAMATWTAPTATDLVDGVLTVSCDRVSGGTFALDLTTVTCAVADRLGNRASATFTVTVSDTTAPSLLVPPPFALTIEATGPAGAQITFNLTAPDAVSGTVPATCLPVNGTMFPIGVTTVTCSATDAAGNRATISFPYTVRDTTVPSVAITSPLVDSVLTGSTAAVVGDARDLVGVTDVRVNGVLASLLDTPTSRRWVAQVPISLPVPFGGAITFTAVARDAAGNSSTAVYTLDNDGIMSSLDRRRADGVDQSRVFSNEFVGQNGATRGAILDRGGRIVNVTSLSDGGVVATVSGPGSRAVIAACGGSPKEVWLDQAGEQAWITCDPATTQTVKVRAARASPYLEIRKLVRRVFGSSYWTTSYLPTGQAVTTGSPLTADPENTEPVSADIVRIDNTGVETIVGKVVLDPTESIDVDVVEGADGGAVVNLQALAGNVEVTVTGHTITLGADQPARAMPVGAKQALHGVRAELLALRSTATSKSDRKRLDDAIASLTEAVRAEAWLDPLTVKLKAGPKVFEEMKEAATRLRELLTERRSTVPDTRLKDLIERIMAASRMLASLAIDDLRDTPNSAIRLKLAEREREAGDRAAAGAKVESAIEHYRNAWALASPWHVIPRAPGT